MLGFITPKPPSPTSLYYIEKVKRNVWRGVYEDGGSGVSVV